VYWFECTACGPEAEPPPPRFNSPQQLWHDLFSSDYYGWSIQADGRVLCRPHSDAAQCEAGGHAVGVWSAHPLNRDHEWRFCLRCGGGFEQRIKTSRPQNTWRTRLARSLHSRGRLGLPSFLRR
jgi:hypothetical protein